MDASASTRQALSKHSVQAQDATILAIYFTPGRIY